MWPVVLILTVLSGALAGTLLGVLFTMALHWPFMS